MPNFWATIPLTHSYCDLLQEVITQPKLYIIRVHIPLVTVIIRDGKMTQSTLVSTIWLVGKSLPYFWIVNHDIAQRLPVTTCLLQSRTLLGNENITVENTRMEQKKECLTSPPGFLDSGITEIGPPGSLIYII